jgi:hypothetical protein
MGLISSAATPSPYAGAANRGVPTPAPPPGLFVVLVVPLGIALGDPLPPVAGVIGGGVRTHAVRRVALVAMLDPLVLEAVVPVAMGIPKVFGWVCHCGHRTPRWRGEA